MSFSYIIYNMIVLECKHWLAKFKARCLKEFLALPGPNIHSCRKWMYFAASVGTAACEKNDEIKCQYHDSLFYFSLCALCFWVSRFGWDSWCGLLALACRWNDQWEDCKDLQVVTWSSLAANRQHQYHYYQCPLVGWHRIYFILSPQWGTADWN